MLDIQCAWQILLQCPGPRCHHYLRFVPPSQSEIYADGHDGGMWRAFEALMGRLPGDIQEREAARRVVSLPMRLGGFGFRSTKNGSSCVLGIVGGLPHHVFLQTSGRDRAHHGQLAEEGGGEWCLTSCAPRARGWIDAGVRDQIGQSCRTGCALFHLPLLSKANGSRLAVSRVVPH